MQFNLFADLTNDKEFEVSLCNEHGVYTLPSKSFELTHKGENLCIRVYKMANHKFYATPSYGNSTSGFLSPTSTEDHEDGVEGLKQAAYDCLNRIAFKISDEMQFKMDAFITNEAL